MFVSKGAGTFHVPLPDAVTRSTKKPPTNVDGVHRALGALRITGLEPAHPWGHKNLNLARLPIPPYPHISQVTFEKYFSIGDLACQVWQISVKS